MPHYYVRLELNIYLVTNIINVGVVTYYDLNFMIVDFSQNVNFTLYYRLINNIIKIMQRLV